MWRRLTTATLVALVACLAVAGYVEATAENGISTLFRDKGSTLGPGHVRIRGKLHAPKHKCTAGRQVGLYFNRAHKSHRVDTRSSSQNGIAPLRGTWHKTPFPRRLVVIVRSKRVINAFNRYTCLRKRWVWQIHR